MAHNGAATSLRRFLQISFPGSFPALAPLIGLI
jgi:hypothetical protein